MLKIYIIFFLLFINSCISFNYSNLLNFRINNIPKLELRRRNFLKLVPFILSNPANAEKTIDELRKEAYNILDIIEIQKSSIDLPILENKDKKNIQNRDINNKNSIDNKEKINFNIECIINNILINFKNKDADLALTYLKSISAPSNMIKNTDNKKLKILFNESKYGILFGKFEKYIIENYYKDIDENLDNTEIYIVDVRLYTDYNTMLYNGIQFNDIYYPSENEKNKLCSIIYRWTFIKSDDKYLLESCYLVSKNN